MAEGWIKLYRKIRDWEWYTDSHMIHLYIHLLISANSQDNKWRGVEVKRGQLITSLDKLHSQTGISVRSIRTCLERLESTGEVKQTTTNAFRIITICKYEEYQIETRNTDKPNDKPNDKPPTSGMTTNKNIKKDKKEKNSSSPSSAREGDSEKNFYGDMKGSVEMMKRLKQDFGLPTNRYWSLLASYDRECIAKGVQHTSMNDYKTRFCDWVRAHVSNGSDDYKQQMLSDASWSETMCMKYKITPQKLKDTIDEFFVDQQCRGHQSHENLQDAKSHFNSWLMIKINKENNNGNKQLTPKDRFLKEFEQQQREEYQRMGLDLSKMQQASAGTDVF